MRDQEYYERGYDDAPRRARSQNGKKPSVKAFLRSEINAR